MLNSYYEPGDSIRIGTGPECIVLKTKWKPPYIDLTVINVKDY